MYSGAGPVSLIVPLIRIKGSPYTRAMQEDTAYYFVYKGKELKGYIGLLAGQTAEGRKVLTIDTIQSPSLDGEELLANLFKALDSTAKDLGYIGTALPNAMENLFNFDNAETIEKMPIYKDATRIKVTPVHSQSWKYFTQMFGEDKYNSIEEGDFRLLGPISVYSSPFKPKSSESASSSSSALQNNPGGIAFNALPIVTEQAVLGTASLASSGIALPGTAPC